MQELGPMCEFDFYTVILLLNVYVAVRKLQQFLLERLGRCLKLFVSTVGPSCHELAFQLVLAIFIGEKKKKKLAKTELPRECSVE